MISSDTSILSFSSVSHHPSKKDGTCLTSQRLSSGQSRQEYRWGSSLGSVDGTSFRVGQLAFLELPSRLPDSIYVGGDGGIWISRDGGASWQDVQPDTPSPQRIIWLCFDPVQVSTCYAGDSTGRIYRSQGAWRINGNSWISDYLTITTVGSSFSRTPSVPGIFLAGVNGLGVIRLDEAGATWQPSNQGMEHVSIRSLLISRENPGTSGNHRRTRNSGWNLSQNQWVPLNRGIDTEVYPLQEEPHGSTLFAGGEGSVFRSSNQGTSWKKSLLRPGDLTGVRAVAFAFSLTDTNLIDACSNYEMVRISHHTERCFNGIEDQLLFEHFRPLYKTMQEQITG